MSKTQWELQIKIFIEMLQYSLLNLECNVIFSGKLSSPAATSTSTSTPSSTPSTQSSSIFGGASTGANFGGKQHNSTSYGLKLLVVRENVIKITFFIYYSFWLTKRIQNILFGFFTVKMISLPVFK